MAQPGYKGPAWDGTPGFGHDGAFIGQYADSRSRYGLADGRTDFSSP
ncbi:hypothetical protein [Amycolatopsis orientalis]|nr:hypothetical protein [Amycolatopsis orientalis]